MMMSQPPTMPQFSSNLPSTLAGSSIMPPPPSAMPPIPPTPQSASNLNSTFMNPMNAAAATAAQNAYYWEWWNNYNSYFQTVSNPSPFDASFRDDPMRR
jgi:hypothetical protein